ncbi:hypothetical protein ACFWXH_24485 [Mesorhizobium sp. NPDC059054]|uniref:hypothetical protein n=1 Tax=Mesorhizobium sp. NPDC059054 TaxID=3346711 RepID=UPI0036852A06
MTELCRSKPTGFALEISVFTSIIAVSVAGILLGLRFKAAALLAATALLLVGIVIWNSLGLPGPVTVGKSLILMFFSACGYLVGLSLSLWRNRNEE